ncbi:ATP-dependent DNA helicase PIF1 [Lampetra planeri]
MDEPDAQICCSLVIEQLDKSGQSVRRKAVRDATLMLGRSEVRELQLQVLCPGRSAERFWLRDAVVHSRFVREGKGGLRLPHHSTQLLLSNCPPDRLKAFLRTIAGKTMAESGVSSVGTDRKRLLSEAPRSFVTVSPLSARDLQAAREKARLAQAGGGGSSGGGSGGVGGAPLGARQPLAARPDGNVGRGVAGTASKRARSPHGHVESTPKKPLRDCSIAGASDNLPDLLRVARVGRGGSVSLSQEQRAVLEAVLARKNIFFTGSAGTGKSFLLRRIMGTLPPLSTIATASTGVAACHIGGMTLHAFAGMGSGVGPLEQCVTMARRPGVLQRWRSCHTLIIDEVSMVSADFFDKMEAVARAVRGRDEPFGGIQLVLSGDFLQLPPVSRDRTVKRTFSFQAKSWRRCVHLAMELTQVRRQKDQAFIRVLQMVRTGRCTDEVTRCLVATKNNAIEKDGILATRLCTHRDDVQLINTCQLAKLPGETRMFDALDSDPSQAKALDAMCPVEASLQLRKGAQVMLTKNLDVQRGLVNGARGVVTDFSTEKCGLPLVRFACGVVQAVQAERWVVRAGGGNVITRKQLPLRLAWAISIHKSQGMSLDCVEVCLGRVFECGQAYVALSRARSLQGLRVVDFDPCVVRADPDVLRFYAALRREAPLTQGSLNNWLQREDSENS